VFCRGPLWEISAPLQVGNHLERGAGAFTPATTSLEEQKPLAHRRRPTTSPSPVGRPHLCTFPLPHHTGIPLEERPLSHRLAPLANPHSPVMLTDRSAA